MTHPNFYQDTVGDQSVWRCCVCEHDTFSFVRAVSHADCHPAPILHPSFSRPGLVGKKIVFSLLTWNTRDVSILAAKSILAEIKMLEALSIKANWFWWDNGSTDDTVEALKAIFYSQEGTWTIASANIGQSAARNRAIDYALSHSADYVLFVDGDIQLVPISSYAMASYLWTNTGVGCVGMYARNCTKNDDYSVECLNLSGLTTSLPHMAWTQYGMFDCRMFKDGIRFDESDVFSGPGWGFEDDDLALQMMAGGWKSHNSSYFRYLHRNLHSGLNQLPPTLAAKVWMERKSYTYQKWKNHPICAEYVSRLHRQTMPRLTT